MLQYDAACKVFNFTEYLYGTELFGTEVSAMLF